MADCQGVASGDDVAEGVSVIVAASVGDATMTGVEIAAGVVGVVVAVTVGVAVKPAVATIVGVSVPVSVGDAVGKMVGVGDNAADRSTNAGSPKR